MSKLFIVESPNKIKTIQKFVGSDFILKATVGHCFQIDPSDEAIDLEDNYKPTYIAIPKKKKVISDIKDAAEDADICYIATDPDREGEAIGWHVAKNVIKNSCPIKRISFQEITKTAVQHALKNPRDLDTNLFNAQQARAVLDRLVGYKVSPVLWRKVCKGTSAGRVQSIGLRLIVERQEEIDKFVPEEYWDITGTFITKKSEEFQGTYKPSEKLTNEDQVKPILASIGKVKGWILEDATKARKKRSPQPVFNTSSLQQFCSSTFGWDGKKTMRVAQSLYEGASIGGNERTGLITYHRTDSLNISQEALDNVREFIDNKIGSKYLSPSPRKFKSKQSAQEAHEGIRPSHLEFSLQEIRRAVEDDEYKLYEAIYYRFVSCQMADAEFDVTKLTICSNDNKHTFVSNGQVMVFDGFLKYWPYGSAKDEALPNLKISDQLTLKDPKANQHFTKPPAAYNTASLVKTMEENGIGRPSTYATIVSTLLDRGYVEKNGKAFVPTDLGKKVSQYLIANFPEIMNMNYTARIEDELDKIASHGKVWHKVVDSFFKELRKRLEASRDSASMKEKTESEFTCPVCNKNKLIKLFGKFGPFYGCSGYLLKGKEKCKAIFKIGPNDEPVEKPQKEVKYIENVKCDKCGSPIVIRKGHKSGKEFGGCSKWPKCRGIFSLDGTPIIINSKFKKRSSS